MKRSLRFVSMVLIWVMAFAVFSTTAFAAGPTVTVSANLQKAKLAVTEVIKDDPGDPSINTVLWDDTTKVEEAVPLYDYNGNVNAYLFRLSTQGVQQGFAVVNLSTGEPYAETYSREGDAAVDCMMMCWYGRRITAEDHIIRVNAYAYLLPDGDSFIDLETNQPVPESLTELKSAYATQLNALKDSRKALLSQPEIVPNGYYPISYTLETSNPFKMSQFPSDANNCGPTACTNLIYYWRNAEPKLWTGAVYGDLKTLLGYSPSYGTYNNRFYDALVKYGNKRGAPPHGSDQRLSGKVDWNFIATNVYNGIPVLLCLTKYKTAKEGHAVVCFGFSKATTTPTLVLADGWSNQLTTYVYNNAVDIERALYSRWN